MRDGHCLGGVPQGSGSASSLEKVFCDIVMQKAKENCRVERLQSGSLEILLTSSHCHRPLFFFLSCSVLYCSQKRTSQQVNQSELEIDSFIDALVCSDQF